MKTMFATLSELVHFCEELEGLLHVVRIRKDLADKLKVSVCLCDASDVFRVAAAFVLDSERDLFESFF